MSENLKGNIKEAILKHCTGQFHLEFDLDKLDNIVNDIVNIDEMKQMKEDAINYNWIQSPDRMGS